MLVPVHGFQVHSRGNISSSLVLFIALCCYAAAHKRSFWKDIQLRSEEGGQAMFNDIRWLYFSAKAMGRCFSTKKRYLCKLWQNIKLRLTTVIFNSPVIQKRLLGIGQNSGSSNFAFARECQWQTRIFFGTALNWQKRTAGCASGGRVTWQRHLNPEWMSNDDKEGQHKVKAKKCSKRINENVKKFSKILK